MKLIVGLGNPGKQYITTRHNIGFRVLDSLTSDWILHKRCNALIHKTDSIIYAKPQTFMNLSGQSVKNLCRFYKVSPPDIIMVYDDKDLLFGKLRWRESGSSGGHNGIKSIITELGTEAIARLKIGIAQANMQSDTANFVLAKFTSEEEQSLPNIIEQAKTRLNETINKKHPLI